MAEQGSDDDFEDLFPSDSSKWRHEGRYTTDIGDRGEREARSQDTGMGPPMSQTVQGAYSADNFFDEHFGETASQRAARERQEDREDRVLDSFDITAANRTWHHTYDFAQDQVEYSPNYPSASELRTPPSAYLYGSTSASGSGSGSGSGSAGVHAQSGPSSAAYIIPGQPTHQMEIEDPQMTTYPPPAARRSHRSSAGTQAARSSSRHGSSARSRLAQSPQTYDTYYEQQYPQHHASEEQDLEQEYPQEQYYPEEQNPEEQHPEEQHPEEHYPEEQYPEQQQQYVAPRRRRRSTRSSGGRRTSGRSSKGSECCVIL